MRCGTRRGWIYAGRLRREQTERIGLEIPSIRLRRRCGRMLENTVGGARLSSMDTYPDIFLGLQPQKSPTAAIEFALLCATADNHIDLLRFVATDGHKFAGVQGQPGWLIERRDSSSPSGAPGYESWPVWASFRAYVEPEGYLLAHPEVYLGGEEFYGYLCKVLESYIRANGAKADLADALLNDILDRRDGWSLGRVRGDSPDPLSLYVKKAHLH